ncbi:MAG: hypothetical protein RL533_1051, partial [Pseudomonadota bacterium]
VYNELVKRRPDLIPAMFTPYPTDRRGEVPEGRDPWFEIPIFNWYHGELSCVYLRHYIEAFICATILRKRNAAFQMHHALLRSKWR